MNKSVSFKISAAMQEIAKMLGNKIKKVTGRDDAAFIVLISDAKGQVHYVSNCEREQSATLLYSLLKGWSNRDDHVATHVREMIENAGDA